eukprot:CAMPEP_0113867060 /NCGR_PEP_ID=MMETSP0780_2-20120614/213_1 /TAXON_ID=652834 /ORGANISM="Palpitomonas bilix" /LENGTH=151 /DNA_ID=CAMNT_0000851969 /DNA_START=496 /DNA_END=951 /DNA_ORIENTATION=- /assembly_acc=CAM_ASM_000599
MVALIFSLVLGLLLYLFKRGARTLQLQLDRSHSLTNMRVHLDRERLNLLMTDRDFDANDYEALLALDEEMNHGKVALTSTDLDRFPIYTMPPREDNLKDEGQEAYRCSICLELLLPGNVARLLPCMHQFHADCVDKWLLMDARCPVCKLAV